MKETFSNLSTIGSIAKELSTYKSNQQLSPAEFVDSFGEGIHEKLSNPDGVPVLICAHNEEKRLPHALYSLSKSETPLRALVVNNASTDKTEELAMDLGATVINEDRPGLIYALVAGFRYIAENEVDPEIILHTDADCLPLPSWASSMIDHVSKIPSETGGQVFAPVAFFGKLSRDILRTAISGSMDWCYYQKGYSRPHGPNGIIRVDDDGEILNRLSTIPNPAPITGTDDYVRDVISNAGGLHSYNWDWRALMLTSGDRYANAFEIFHCFLNPEYRRIIYEQWYDNAPDGIRYTTVNKPTVHTYE